MPAYKDEQRGTWYSKFYYQTWDGERKQKKKRGFRTRREAVEFEDKFLKTIAGDVNMPFEAFAKVYMEDMSHRLRQSTVESKRFMIDLKLIPFFGKKPLNEIKATDVRRWQNEMMSKGYSPTYLKTLNNQLTAIFNYAVKYYSLSENPCHKAGSMGKKKAEEMQFWTFEEYSKFEQAVRHKIRTHTAFELLYYTGMRIGELLALTPSDVVLKACTISISKTYQRLGGKDVVTPPKTPKSKRVISIPEFLRDELKDYLSSIYGLKDTDRIFPVTKYALTHDMENYSKKAGIKKIRLHDLRHSHASLLIEKGFSPLLIADRLGHENVETTLNTYSHLYPTKESELISCLQGLKSMNNMKT
ncbi:Integrase [uncultured Ruminococcus sp.]|nr:Integrase [uncultured Clostridium sp.]SCI13294.1 Integrase [uncultured Ruminococcus sp.]